ncbi:hypothetical protein CCHR01_13249 [Colletotrichum chrysophilum]|uniref:Uncharacterized protein n=1 Tax=Colletotrichum chrysophilum TaxID=1836956 RepID=A0AAD9EDD0_9PEZI|nr:hypothetical protein CCHR01_13249 [Colletotrichum chrysophilum]
MERTEFVADDLRESENVSPNSARRRRRGCRVSDRITITRLELLHAASTVEKRGLADDASRKRCRSRLDA